MQKINNIPVIYKFKKNKHGNLIGCVLAASRDNVFSIGWSLTHKNDVFNKERAIEIAFARAFDDRIRIVPDSLSADITEMEARALRYFKVSEKIVDA